jgi:phage FluMu gp28-like protein
VINPDTEIERLRWFLVGNTDIERFFIDDLCDLAAKEINEIILEIVDDAVAEAIDYASEIGCPEFIEELDVIDSGDSYRIHTISGKTDFSVPEFPMKNSLLKNAETSEDGKKYKVIPVGAPSNNPRPNFTSSFQVQQARQSLIRDARDSLKNNPSDRRSEWSKSMTDNYRHRLRSNIQQRKQFYSEQRSSIKKDIAFRTVTEDTPDEAWVRPARELDMTGFLMDLNGRIEMNMNQHITSVIDTYMNEFRSM